MRFECYTEMQAPENVKDKPEGGVNQHTIFQDTIELVKDADRLGFDVYNTVDHPFFPDFGVSSNPLAMWSNLAPQTESIRFRTLAHVTGLYHPSVLAGQITAADHLTEGRLELGFATGHPWLFPNVGIEMDRVRGRSKECREILLQALEDGRVSYKGEYYELENVTISPRPYQDSYEIFTGGTSEKTCRLAGREGWGIVITPFFPVDYAREMMEVYRKACDDHGNEPDINFLHAIFIDHDEKRIREKAERAIKAFIQCNVWPNQFTPPAKVLERNGFEFYTSGLLESYLEKTWDELVEEEIIWAGTPEQVTEYVVSLIDTFEDLSAVTVLPHYGGLEYELASQSLSLFAEEVMPHFQSDRST